MKLTINFGYWNRFGLGSAFVKALIVLGYHFAADALIALSLYLASIQLTLTDAKLAAAIAGVNMVLAYLVHWLKTQGPQTVSAPVDPTIVAEPLA